MRKRVLPLLIVPMLVLAFVAMALTPLSASAATIVSTHSRTASQHVNSLSKKGHQSSPQVRPFTSNNVVNPNLNPVMGNIAHVYAIFWDPVGNVSANYTSLIERYFNDIGGTGLYNNNSQYTDANGDTPFDSVLAGVFFDTTSYPESPLFDSDIQNEVTNAQNANGWSSSLDNVFFVFTDKGQDVCLNSAACASSGLCGYHGHFGSDTIYAAIPYAASFGCRAPAQTEPNGDDADLTINLTSHEQMEAATDPLGNAWNNNPTPESEIADKCDFIFGSLDANNGDLNVNGDEYMVQEEWDNNVSGCVMTGP